MNKNLGIWVENFVMVVGTILIFPVLVVYNVLCRNSKGGKLF